MFTHGKPGQYLKHAGVLAFVKCVIPSAVVCGGQEMGGFFLTK